jgi:flagellar FliJ protein
MKSLRTLLKLAERELEDLRRLMGEQIQRLTALEQRIEGHGATARAEQALAKRDYESARAYGGYAARALQARRAMESEKKIIEGEIERIRALITEAHVEARKFERLIELDEAREKAKREKRENDELDEFATLRAARQGVSGL